MVLKKKKVSVSLYNCEVEFIITDDVKKVMGSIYRKLKIQKHFEEEVEGITISSDIDKYYLVIFSSYLTHNTISHEMSHIVDMITGDRDIEDGETRAWLNGHLTGLLYKFLDKQKLSVKHGS